MTAKSSLLKIKKCLTDEEILGLHLEGCPHIDNSDGNYELIAKCSENTNDCAKCWLNAIKSLE